MANLPSQVTGLSTNSGPSVGNLSLTWNIPNNGGSYIITSYTLQYRISGTGSWTTITNILPNNPQFLVAVGTQLNHIAYSYDGLTWYGLGEFIFNQGGTGVAYNGNMWLAFGTGANTIAYSYNGINWTALGNSIFSVGAAGAWNGTMWVAVGLGSNTIAYSYNGTSWTGLGNILFDINNGGNDVAWNGTMWIAVGRAGSNTIAYSYDGINWTGLGNTIFSISGNGIKWNGTMWVAVGMGTNTIAYSYNGINWTGLGNIIFDSCQKVAWNGNMWVAVGVSSPSNTTLQNTLAYSYDGINWTGLGRSIFINTARGITWSGTRWIATGGGASSGENTIAYSSNGINWTGLGNTIFSITGRNVASNFVPVTTTPSYTISGLANGTTFDIQVAAVNQAGTGPYSIPVLGTTFAAPNSPTNLQGVRGNTQVSLTWTPPNNNGGTPITGYLVERSTSSSGPWTPFTTGSTSPSYVVTGLTNGTLYYFRVSGVNIVGSGTPSSTISLTPSTIPGPSVIISSVKCDNQQSLVTWAAPVDTGGEPILSYNLQYSSTSSTGPWLPTTPYSVAASITSYMFTGLTNGTQYYFQVSAINLNGQGPYSIQTANSTATPSITSQPPSPITTTAITSTSIALSWTAPTGLANTGGNPITGYIIYWSQISSTGSIIPPTYSYNTTSGGTPTATTYTISGLTYATLYTIQISSINCSGIGPLSAIPLYVTTSSIPPSAPTNLVISGCNSGYTNSVILTWTAPANNGGSPITNYIIYYRTTSPVGVWYTYNTSSTATTAIVPLPASSTSYDFKIAAQNIAGIGVFSSPIVSSSSYNPPTTPTNLVSTNLISNTSSNGSIVLSWSPSTQEAPQTISYYIVEYKICEFGGWITYPTPIEHPSTSTTLSNIGASSSSNIANNLPYLFRVYAVNSCGAKSGLTNVSTAISYNNDAPTRLWSRFNSNCSGNITSFDSLTRNMLRKGQILQYPEVGTLQYSRAMLWSMTAKNQITRKKAWASQSQEYTYPNTTNINNEPGVGLRQTPTSLVCWTPPPTIICNPTSSSDVPGNSTTLCISKNAPFNNFRHPNTYASGGTKWPIFFSK